MGRGPRAEERHAGTARAGHNTARVSRSSLPRAGVRRRQWRARSAPPPPGAEHRPPPQTRVAVSPPPPFSRPGPSSLGLGILSSSCALAAWGLVRDFVGKPGAEAQKASRWTRCDYARRRGGAREGGPGNRLIIAVWGGSCCAVLAEAEAESGGELVFVCPRARGIHHLIILLALLNFD